MARKYKQIRLTRLSNAGRTALIIALLTLSIGVAAAEPSRGIPGPELEKLMVKVNAEHPDARILKVEREAEGGGVDLYEVKLLRTDGQVLKLYFDVATLAPVTRSDHDDGTPERRRLHERKRGHW